MNNRTECLGLSFRPKYFLGSILCLWLSVGLSACSNDSNSTTVSDMAIDMSQEIPTTDMLSVPCAGEDHGEVSGGEISGGEVNAGEENSGEISGGGVNAGELNGGETSGGEVDAEEMSAGEINGGEMEGGEISDGEMSAGNVAGMEMTSNPEASSRYDRNER